MSADLGTLAFEFANKVSKIINGTVSSNIEFVVDLVQGGQEAFIYPKGSTYSKHKFIPVTCGFESDSDQWLWMKVQFKVFLHPTRGYLTVDSSVYGLGISGNPFHPALRIEFERGRGFEPEHATVGFHSRNAAHVQIHGVSNEIHYIQHRLGQTRIRKLEEFHFPVGGRRFRPSLEDFIEFIETENLVTRLNEGAREVINENRKEWLGIQLQAAVANDPEIAAEKLREMGYQVRREN